MTEPEGDILARLRRRAEDAPAHPLELLGWLAAEDSHETDRDRV